MSEYFDLWQEFLENRGKREAAARKMLAAVCESFGKTIRGFIDAPWLLPCSVHLHDYFDENELGYENGYGASLAVCPFLRYAVDGSGDMEAIFEIAQKTGSEYESLEEAMSDEKFYWFAIGISGMPLTYSLSGNEESPYERARQISRRIYKNIVRGPEIMFEPWFAGKVKSGKINLDRPSFMAGDRPLSHTVNFWLLENKDNDIDIMTSVSKAWRNPSVDEASHLGVLKADTKPGDIARMAVEYYEASVEEQSESPRP